MAAYVYEPINEDEKIILPVVFKGSDDGFGIKITFEIPVSNHDSKIEVNRRGVVEAKRLAALLLEGRFD